MRTSVGMDMPDDFTEMKDSESRLSGGYRETYLSSAFHENYNGNGPTSVDKFRIEDTFMNYDVTVRTTGHFENVHGERIFVEDVRDVSVSNTELTEKGQAVLMGAMGLIGGAAVLGFTVYSMGKN